MSNIFATYPNQYFAPFGPSIILNKSNTNTVVPKEKPKKSVVIPTTYTSFYYPPFGPSVMKK